MSPSSPTTYYVDSSVLDIFLRESDCSFSHAQDVECSDAHPRLVLWMDPLTRKVLDLIIVCDEGESALQSAILQSGIQREKDDVASYRKQEKKS